MALSGVWNRINGAMVGLALGRASTDAVTPVLENAKQRAWAERAVRVLDVGTAAQADALGIEHGVNYQDDAKRQGVGVNRYRVLRDMAGSAPGLGQLLQMRNRGIIRDEGVKRGLQQNGVREEWHEQALALRFGVLDAGTLAQLVARGLLDDDPARVLAEDAGTPADVFSRMVLAATNAPQMGQVLEWGNRTGRTDEEVAAALGATGLRETWRGRVAQLRHYLTPPSDLIRMAVREVFSPELRGELTLDQDFPDAVMEHASKLGIDRETMGNYWAAHWELPSRGEGAQMMFRGEISPAEYRDLLRALDYAPKWRGPLAAIARAIPTITDFQRLVRRGVYGGDERQEFQYDAEYPAEFTAKMALHGLSEQDARDLWAGGWRMPSAGQLDHMLWRGEITEAQLHKGLKALDYPVFWRDKLAAIARPTLGRIDLRRLYAEGVLTEADVLAGYKRLGFADREAKWLTDFAVKIAKGGEKEATAADFLALFNGHRIAYSSALTELRGLGYSAEDAARKVDVLDARKVASAITTAIGGLHSAYKKHDANAAEVEAGLVKLGVAEWARAAMVAAWTVERDVARPELSIAQVVAAYRRAVITRDAALAELTSRDYTPERAAELLDTAALTLTVKQIQDAVDAGTLTRDQGLERLREQGYTADDAAILLPEPKPETTP